MTVPLEIQASYDLDSGHTLAHLVVGLRHQLDRAVDYDGLTQSAHYHLRYKSGQSARSSFQATHDARRSPIHEAT